VKTQLRSRDETNLTIKEYLKSPGNVISAMNMCPKTWITSCLSHGSCLKRAIRRTVLQARHRHNLRLLPQLIKTSSTRQAIQSHPCQKVNHYPRNPAWDSAHRQRLQALVRLRRRKWQCLRPNKRESCRLSLLKTRIKELRIYSCSSLMKTRICCFWRNETTRLC
jgi:hypothetical protein